jgi:hypothetical protein
MHNDKIAYFYYYLTFQWNSHTWRSIHYLRHKQILAQLCAWLGTIYSSGFREIRLLFKLKDLFNSEKITKLLLNFVVSILKKYEEDFYDDDDNTCLFFLFQP